jgi:hypothetical protein
MNFGGIKNRFVHLMKEKGRTSLFFKKKLVLESLGFEE